MCWMPPKSPTIAGSAVATIVWSSAASRRTSMSPPKITRRRGRSGATVLTSRPAVPLRVLGRDVGRVLVPVPDARVRVEIVGWVARVERAADPLDRQRLVHEAAGRAVEGEALAPVPPALGLVRGAEGIRSLVAAVPHEPLAAAA